MKRVTVVDSHTGGEPTRVVLGGGPDLGGGSLAERRERMRAEFDRFRNAVTCEPRGSDILVGALLVPPTNPSCTAGVIFFDNATYLGMCGHGTIGVVVTLAHLGRIGSGPLRLETPVGIVEAELHADGRVSLTNVPAHRSRSAVQVDVRGLGTVTGDIAWGGNWFFVVPVLETLREEDVGALAERTWAIRRALQDAGITGDDGADVDHVQLVAPSPVTGLDSRNFVLCPGMAYDRSPCGTGTSARLACLAADGALAPRQVFRQESITGSVFEAWYEPEAGGRPGAVRPHLTGSAHITAEATLLLDERDPLCWGRPWAAGS